jgi:hypothetical protein
MTARPGLPLDLRVWVSKSLARKSAHSQIRLNLLRNRSREKLGSPPVAIFAAAEMRSVASSIGARWKNVQCRTFDGALAGR